MQNRTHRICFIINPAADRRRSVRHITWIQQEAKKRWHHYEVVLTNANQSVKELARDKADTFDIVVACGGDGTVSHVANGLVNSGAALGVLPIGSGNDFAKSMELDRTLPECMDILQSAHLTYIDLIRYEGDATGWCANTLGSGLDGLASYYASRYQHLKGFLVYALGALKAAYHFRGTKMRLIIDGVETSDDYLMVTVCNGKWEGGRFYVAPEALMNDGFLDLLLIKKLPLPLILSYLPRFRWGPSKWMKGVHSIRCKSVEFYSDDEIYAHRDGEFVSNSIKHLKMNISEKSLKVIGVKK
ncbi:MAG: YegS/Rv2252/BmrU family lipid kinase [Balneolaceae bacterium]